VKDVAGNRRRQSVTMVASGLPAAEEQARLSAVGRYTAPDAPPDEIFDRLVELAARSFAVPIATIAIVDQQAIRFIAQHGLDGIGDIPRHPGLSASAILQDKPYLLTDASADRGALGNPLVRGELGVRFYAAAPIITAEGHRLGAVEVMDRQPRQATQEELWALRDLAAVVAGALELRLSASRAVEAERDLRIQLEREKTLLEQIAALEAGLAAQLQHALQRRVAIEQAKGMLMAREGLDEQAAFQRLRAVARSRRRSVEEVAGKVLAGEPLPPPLRSTRDRPRSSRSEQRGQRQAPAPPSGRAGLIPAFGDVILRITPTDEPVGLRLEGDVDQSNGKALANALAAAAATVRGDLHLDMTALEFIHIEGLRLLVSTAAQLPAGQRLVLDGAPPYLRRIMGLVGWEQAPGLRFGRPARDDDR
jgi:GAF domain-containing protein/anti-anti-sigma regulatory factor